MKLVWKGSTEALLAPIVCIGLYNNYMKIGYLENDNDRSKIIGVMSDMSHSNVTSSCAIILFHHVQLYLGDVFLPISPSNELKYRRNRARYRGAW